MRKGQVVVELMLALAVAVGALAALVQITTKSLSNATFSRDQSTAKSLATTAMEWVRGQKALLGWQAFYAKDTNPGGATIYCLNSDPLSSWPGASGACSGVMAGSIYKREVSLNATGNSNVMATVEVSWTAGSKTYKSIQTTYFTRY